MNMRSTSIIAAILISMHVAGVAGACNCLLAHPLDLFEAQDVVFSGVVESKVVHPWDPALGRLNGQTEYTFHTVQVWKGPMFKTFSVLSDGGCAYSFVAGRHYIVYAHVVDTDDFDRRQVLITTQCWRPQLMNEALWDRAVLRDPFVLDTALAVPRPTVSELEKIANGGDRDMATSAEFALGRRVLKRRTGAH